MNRVTRGFPHPCLALLSLPLAVATSTFAAAQESPGSAVTATVDPVTRYVHVAYRVPTGAPEEVVVLCSWSRPGANAWQPAKVMPLISETAQAMLPEAAWGEWLSQGRITERRAAGLERTAVFNPYPEAQENGKLDVDFRVEVRNAAGQSLAVSQARIQADNSDVVYIEEWSRVLQKDTAVADAAGAERKWTWRTGLPESEGVTFGNALDGDAGPKTPLRPLTYPLDLRGPYALFVCTKPHFGIRLRLTGDERTDSLSSRWRSEETLWCWRRMDRQHLVLKQSHAYTGWTAAQIDYIKLVPLSDELFGKLNAKFGAECDKLIGGYWEPYSWAFSDNVLETLQHREPLSAFAEARIAIVDTQIGRFGDKVVYESRKTDPLLFSTIGDPIGNVEVPETDNVGQMQQYTNTLDATLRYARELGLTAHANFGATNCYPGTPLQSDFSKQHPDWMRGSALRYEVPEVRAYALGLYREALEIGAPGLSLDFCRYPEGIDKAETCNTFLRDLRALADEFGKARGKRVPILVRFPGTGVRQWEMFDYRTWAHEGWVDYVCPSNIQGRHMNIDMTPYFEAVAGTACELLPCVDALSWGLPMPGPFLWRVAKLYEAGAPGLYVYQADGRILGRPEELRCMRLLASSDGVRRFWEEENQLRPKRSKAIYITPADRPEGYNGYERLRVWTDGVELGPMDLYLDDQLVNRCDGPPYLLGAEDYASDKVIPPGEHRLRIRAKDGDGWLEQTFAIKGAG